MNPLVYVGIAVGAVIAIIAVLSYLRRVVDPNQVHIVQSAKSTTSYGISSSNGNVYYAWPSWIPVFGITTVILPVSNFDLSVNNYDAYDQDRVPLVADVAAFFRIEDTNVAAQRVSSIQELTNQLELITQGAIRTILASHTIDQIMMERDTFGDSFTKAVAPELAGWGVVPVKNLELMDIRDANGSKVIENIMAKKKSHIEMESRVEVAENHKLAQKAEIEAKKEVDLKQIDAKKLVDIQDIDAKQLVDQQGIEANRIVDLQEQEAKRIVGEKTADQERTVGMALETSKQDVAEQAAVTAEKDMAVVQVNTVRQAEITREQATVDMETQQINTVRQAEIDREQAEIGLEEAEFSAAAVEKEGAAQASVRKQLFEADNALEIRLNVQKDMTIGVAQALADGNTNLVPEVYIGGNNGEGADGGPTNAVDTLAKIMTMNLVHNTDNNDDNDTAGARKVAKSFSK